MDQSFVTFESSDMLSFFYIKDLDHISMVNELTSCCKEFSLVTELESVRSHELSLELPQELVRSH